MTYPYDDPAHHTHAPPYHPPHHAGPYADAPYPYAPGPASPYMPPGYRPSMHAQPSYPYGPPPPYYPHAEARPPPPGPYIPPSRGFDHAPPPGEAPGAPAHSGPFIPGAQPRLHTHPSIVSSPLPPPPFGSSAYTPGLAAHAPRPPLSHGGHGAPPSPYAPMPPSAQPHFAPPAPQRLSTAEVKLEIKAKGLWDRDVTSKSDPTCVIFLEDRHAGRPPSGYPPFPNATDGYARQQPYFYGTSDPASIKWREVGRTECIKNNLNPEFRVQVTVPYRFEELQHIRLGLWDIDSRKSDLHTHDFLGDVRTTLGELVSSRVWTSPLTSPRAKDTKKMLGGKRDLGTITVIVHENRDGGKMLIKMGLSGQGLDRKDLWRSDPYFIVTQVGASSATSRSQLYRSEVVKKNLYPVWKHCQFHANIPKGGTKSDLMIEILVNDKDKRKRDDEIGVATYSVAELEQLTSVPVINEKRRKRRNYRNSGTLQISHFRALNMPSLVDYLQGGLKLHFSVAIDLTASNGNPAEPRSLHYRQDPYAGNHYVHALVAVFNVLRVYAPSDNRFAAFGFGAELPSRPGVTSPCFPLSLGADPHCAGIEGILGAYNNALSSVKLSGPTNFAPLIDTVSRITAQRPRTQTDQNYDVLLILTDGVVSDFALTVDRIITASKKLPLSIIIVGIGNRDFKKMEELDSDDELLWSVDRTKQAARDICQFVAFREYEGAPPERLGAAVLAELPGNIVDFFVGSCDPPIMPGQGPMLPPHFSSIS